MLAKLLVGAAVALAPLVATPALAYAAPAPVPGGSAVVGGNGRALWTSSTR